MADKIRALKPRLAASLVIIDRDESGKIHVLMGRRRPELAFMPNKFVFPGGRAERGDHYLTCHDDLHENDIARLAPQANQYQAKKYARAIALCAIRESYEETGYAIGAQKTDLPINTKRTIWPNDKIMPAIGGLRYFARAVTPPGQVRRFDTRFFVTMRHAIAWENPLGPPDPEFTEIAWLPIDKLPEDDIAGITHRILGVLKTRIKTDPSLTDKTPQIPGFFTRYGQRIVVQQ